MMSPTEIIHEAEPLPAEERAPVVDFLQYSLNQPDAAIDRQWAEIARYRREALRSGHVVGISGKAVSARLRERFPSWHLFSTLRSKSAQGEIIIAPNENVPTLP